MLKIMANENMDEWRMAPGVVIETIQATKKFLEEHPEELAKLGGKRTNIGTAMPMVGADRIASFLGWEKNLGRVKMALAQMRDTDTTQGGIVELEAIKILPTQGAAEHLRKTVKSISKSTKVSPEAQVRAAKRFLEERPEEKEKAEKLPTLVPEKTHYSKEIILISSFLNWVPRRVHDALSSLRDVESGIVDREAVEMMPLDLPPS